MKQELKNNWIKFVVGWAIVFGIRMIPFRVPNIEPLTATQMPFAKKFGWFGGFIFGFLSIVAFDAVTSGIGVWTWVTAGAFGLLGVLASFFFKNREGNMKNFVFFGIAGTLFYDAITGLTIGPIFWGQSFVEAFIGQIPFTLYHLSGNIVFSAAISPLIHRWVTGNEKLEANHAREAFGFAKK